MRSHFEDPSYENPFEDDPAAPLPGTPTHVTRTIEVWRKEFTNPGNGAKGSVLVEVEGKTLSMQLVIGQNKQQVVFPVECAHAIREILGVATAIGIGESAGVALAKKGRRE